MAAVAASQGIESELVPKIATAFCSGLAETGGMCGALNGAIMGLSMLEGRGSEEDSRAALYAKVRQLIEVFEGQFGAKTCPQLLELQMSTAEASATNEERQLYWQCKEYVREATRMAVSLLDG